MEVTAHTLLFCRLVSTSRKNGYRTPVVKVRVVFIPRPCAQHALMRRWKRPQWASWERRFAGSGNPIGHRHNYTLIKIAYCSIPTQHNTVASGVPEANTPQEHNAVCFIFCLILMIYYIFTYRFRTHRSFALVVYINFILRLNPQLFCPFVVFLALTNTTTFRENDYKPTQIHASFCTEMLNIACVTDEMRNFLGRNFKVVARGICNIFTAKCDCLSLESIQIYTSNTRLTI